jgi:hypothetical protein
VHKTRFSNRTIVAFTKALSFRKVNGTKSRENLLRIPPSSQVMSNSWCSVWIYYLLWYYLCMLAILPNNTLYIMNNDLFYIWLAFLKCCLYVNASLQNIKIGRVKIIWNIYLSHMAGRVHCCWAPFYNHVVATILNDKRRTERHQKPPWRYNLSYNIPYYWWMILVNIGYQWI